MYPGPEIDNRVASPIQGYMARLRDRMLENRDGEVASYIPELAKADPEAYGMAVVTLDGTCYTIGEADVPFTIQSMSKPFTYGAALMRHGREKVLRHVGVEPTGEAFNSIILDETNNRPFNPMVNAGAISVASLLTGPGDVDQMRQLFSRLAGRDLAIDQDVYVSEKATGHRNRAIAYLMLNSGMIENDPEEVLDLYFQQCAIEVTCADMARMAAVLGNMGVAPGTEDRIFSADAVQDVLTLMNTCGMYDYAGQWAYEVGIPAKSGVAGGIIAVLPGQGGIAVWSPRLDTFGNSVRGVETCREVSRTFGLHAFAQSNQPGTVIRHSYHLGEAGSKRVRSAGARAYLREHGRKVLVLELQGALRFGGMETVIRTLTEGAATFSEIVIDLARAGSVERPAARMLVQSLMTFCNTGYRVTLSGVSGAGSSGLVRVEAEAEGLPAEFLPDLDAALEQAETRLLMGHQEMSDTARYALPDMSILSGLSSEDYRALESIVRVYRYGDGEQIIAHDAQVEAVFLVASGVVDLTLPGADGRSRRLVSVGPGQCFGEAALADGAAMAADAHAKGAATCYALPVAELRDLSAERPGLIPAILSNVVRSLGARLRHAHDEIRRLE